MFVVILTLCLQLWFGNVNCWIHQPIGPELCKRQCCIMVGSALCVYELQLMKCLQTTGNKEANSSSDNTMLNFHQKCDFLGIKQYRNCSRIVSSKTKGTICMTHSTSGSLVVPRGLNVRLLMTDFHKNDFTNYLQMNMLNQSVTGYKFIESIYVTALVYIKDMKKVFVVSAIPSVIESYRLDKYDNEILLEKSDKLTVTALIAENIMVPYKFYFCTHKNILYKMTVTGTRKKIINIRGHMKIYSITIDPYKKTLYACRRTHLLVLERGRVIKTLMKKSNAMYNAVSFNKVDRSLYYNDDREVRKFSGRISSKVLSLAHPIRHISVNGYRLYVSFDKMDYCKLSEIDPTTGQHQLIDLTPRFSGQFVFTVVD